MIDLSYKRILDYISDEISGTQTNKGLMPRSQSYLEIGVLVTHKANEILSDMKLDISEFSGTPKIVFQDGREELKLPEHVKKDDTFSAQEKILQEYTSELLRHDELIIKLESNSAGGIFKWLDKDERWLLITVYVVDPTRQSHQSLSDSPLPIRFTPINRQAQNTYSKAMAKLIYNVIVDMKNKYKVEFDASYRRFLDYAFQPFENFLYNERLSIRNPEFRPKCNYTKREVKNGDDRGYLEIEDPPRQITEGGNSVVPIAKEKKRQYYSARVTDYDEFERLLIFNEKFRMKDWPEKGQLILEGDMASNRRKWNAIKQLKGRGLATHARLADVLIRPWGLPPVTGEARTYFNKDISHDNLESQPQAVAIDMALATDDVALIHGPPGTGKTTVIVEIIRHVISNGGRVIMCAPTHVAVDNVLERTTDIKGISAVRVGGRAYMDQNLEKYRLKNKANSLSSALLSYTKAKGKDKDISVAQTRFTESMEDKGYRYMENLAINQANLICGTTIGIARFEPPKDNPIDFDVLIIDEASKATVMEFLVPAVRAKKWILVGDHRQLPPYVNEQEIRIYVQRFFKEIDDSVELDNEALKENDSPEIYDDRTNNLIGSLRRYHEELHALEDGQVDFHWKRIVELFNSKRKHIKSVEEMINLALGSCFHYFLKQLDPSRNSRLLVQHRMPKLLAEFLDDEIYKGQLKTSKSAATHGLELPGIPSLGIKKITDPITFISTEMLNNHYETPGRYKGYYNTPEAEVIAEIVSILTTLDVESLGYSDDNPMTIGIITYYAGQSREINRKLRTIDEIERDRGWRYNVVGKPIRIRVSIVDRFQGQEQSIVILSLTRSNNKGMIGFLKNLQRVNVSLSRAKQNLLIVGNAHFFSSLRVKPVPVLKNLAIYCKKKGLIKHAMEEELL